MHGHDPLLIILILLLVGAAVTHQVRRQTDLANALTVGFAAVVTLIAILTFAFPGNTQHEEHPADPSPSTSSPRPPV
ncbi:hypothetical protein [Streptomyces sp. NPDC090135]|uniref:hypothetical protein n=1 Tax=Streptomyces sp. NPDC090135 TaxID=3365957 RepID=UPI0037F7D17A